MTRDRREEHHDLWLATLAYVQVSLFPRLIRSYTASTVRGVELALIRPGKPIENCFVESFNGRGTRRGSDVGGTSIALSQLRVSCQNNTSGRDVRFLPTGILIWSCVEQGLVRQVGDRVEQAFDGVADSSQRPQEQLERLSPSAPCISIDRGPLTLVADLTADDGQVDPRLRDPLEGHRHDVL